MNIQFELFEDEIEELVSFLTSQTWKFYGVPNLTADKIRSHYEKGHYCSTDCQTIWIISEVDTKVGIIRLFDLENGNPLFDIRILNEYKDLGIGTIAIKWLTSHVFNHYDKNRIEAHTRQDNYAMRCVLHKCGFVKEGHHRLAWVGQDQMPYDAISYGMTRQDYEQGMMTPVIWNDFKC